MADRQIRATRLFQSTLSVRRATDAAGREALLFVFQSTLSVRRATDLDLSAAVKVAISIHALRKESDVGVHDHVVCGTVKSAVNVAFW